jgi:hypothetical protein
MSSLTLTLSQREGTISVGCAEASFFCQASLARRHTLLEFVRPKAITKVAEAFIRQPFASVEVEQDFNGRGDVIIAHALAER